MSGKIYCSIGEKEYLNREELYAWLGVGEKMIDRFMKQGLPYLRLGTHKNNKLLFKKQDVIKFLDKTFKVKN